MIIACEKCQTRLKVGDEKFAAGPIRVRCSKCNHVFLANGPNAAGASPSPLGAPFGAGPLGPNPLVAHAATTAPPAVGTPGPITGMFSMGAANLPQPAVQAAGIFKPPPPQETLRINHVPPGASSSPPGFSAMPPPPGFGPPPSLPPTTTANAFGQNPLSQPPSASLPATQVVGKGGAPPADDPFRGLDQFGRRPTPRPQTPPAQSIDPFAPKPTPRPVNDPFGNAPTVALGAQGQPPRIGAVDPFGLGQPPTPPARAPTPAASASPFGGPKSDPFAGLTSSSSSSPPSTTPMPRSPTRDPFAGLPPASSSVPVDPFAQLSSPPSHASSSAAASAAALPDPFSSTEPFDPQALMTTAPSSPPQSALPDPFGMSPPPPIPSEGAIGANAQQETGAWSPPQSSPSHSSSPPAPPPDDPFAGLDAEIGAADAQSLFDAPNGAAVGGDGEQAGSPGMVAMPASAQRSEAARPAANASTFQAPPPTTGADMKKVRRAEATQRVKEIAWAALQSLLFVAFVVVAVVLARGGRVDDLLRGDVRAAFSGERVKDGLSVEGVHVARRTLPSGIDVVVVTGVVVNTGAQVPAARVDVRFGDGPWNSGWAWSGIDGVDVDALKDAPDAAPLSMRPPKSAVVAPGDRAPFVVVAPAPAEGLKAYVAVTAAKS